MNENVYLSPDMLFNSSRNKLILIGGLASPNPTGPPGGNKTDLATGRGASLDGGRLTDMLVVATTVGMLHRVHSHTTHLK